MLHPGSLAWTCVLLAAVVIATRAVADDRLRPEVSAASATFDATDVRCPSDFEQGLPSGVLCVYDGVAVGPDGQACPDRVTVVWTRLAPELNRERRPDLSYVFFGFVGFPEWVVRATADSGSRAAFLDAASGDQPGRDRLYGHAEIRLAAAGSAATEVLSLAFQKPVIFGNCAVASYDGTFVGLMRISQDDYDDVSR